MLNLDADALPIVVMEDDPIHTATHPFCSIDPTCPCHEDPDGIAQVAAFVEQGLLTPTEATGFVAGTLLDWDEQEVHA